MRIPDKAQHGANFKQWTVDTLNAIIDYLNASRVRPGPGIMVDETPSGTLLKLDPRARGTTIQQIITGGTASTTPQEITATIDGGTASISLTGGTESINLVEGSNVTIQEGDPGEIIISATGGTGGTNIFFPDYVETPYPVNDPIAADTSITAPQDMWLIGYAGLDGVPSGEDYVELHISRGIFSPVNFTLFHLSTYYESIPSRRILVPVCFPIKSGCTFEIFESGHVTSYLKLYYT